MIKGHEKYYLNRASATLYIIFYLFYCSWIALAVSVKHEEAFLEAIWGFLETFLALQVFFIFGLAVLLLAIWRLVTRRQNFVIMFSLLYILSAYWMFEVRRAIESL